MYAFPNLADLINFCIFVKVLFTYFIDIYNNQNCFTKSCISDLKTL